MNAKQNNSHTKGNGHGTHYRRWMRRKEAEERQGARSERSVTEQLARLDLGNYGAVKERFRLSDIVTTGTLKKGKRNK